jgi:glyoxalase family protein
MKPALLGIHHVTAVTANARENHRFYTDTLGLRLVKKTVNQDDVRAYHLFYADAKGSPGTDLTFFDWAHTPPQRHGNHSVSRTGLRVGGVESLHWWAARFDQLKIARSEILERDERAVIDFEDGEGQQLSLVDDGNAGSSSPWSGSPVPAKYQIRGLGPVTITIPELALTHYLLTEVMGMRPAREYADSAKTRVQVYEVAGGGPWAELHVRLRPDLAPYRPGAGGAFTTSPSGSPMRKLIMPGRADCEILVFRTAERLTAIISRACTSANQITSSLNSRPTARDSQSTKMFPILAKTLRCRRSWKGEGPRSKPTSKSFKPKNRR